MVTPAGTFTYAYDNDDRLSTLTNPFSEQSAWQYDTDSRLQSQTLGNGIVSSYAYNARSFLTDLLNKGGSTTLSEFGGSTPSTAMTYDALGDVTSVKSNVPAAPSSYSGTTSYQYDGKTELTQEASTRSGGYTNANSYDLAENPTQVRGVAQATANADNQIPVSGVTYDGNGNPSKVEGLTAAFDILNRATALGSVSNTWGANGLRASKTTSGGTTYFLYDGSVPVCELSSTGSVTATNTFGGAGLISRRSGSTSTFYTFDEQGNVAQRYTSTGSLVSSDLYDAFGKGTSTGGGDVFAYEGQAGYYTDTSTGLILCGHRFYDSAAGRFINRDPIGYAGGINLYGYTGNNASNRIDPTGFATFGQGVGGEFGVGIAGVFGVYVGGSVSIQADTSGNVAIAVSQEGGGSLSGETGLHGGVNQFGSFSPGNMDNPNTGSADTSFSNTENSTSDGGSFGPLQGSIDTPNGGGSPTVSVGFGPARDGGGISLGIPGQTTTSGFNPGAMITNGIPTLYPPTSASPSPVPFFPYNPSPTPSGGGCP